MWIKDLTRIYYRIEGFVGRRDRRHAQPSSSRLAQPREPVITGSSTVVECDPDACQILPTALTCSSEAGNPLRPKASPWAVPVLALEDRHIQPGRPSVLNSSSRPDKRTRMIMRNNSGFAPVTFPTPVVSRDVSSGFTPLLICVIWFLRHV
ncbi:hypothetical protein GQ457_12G015790 [Hibiscus cannabinus]